MSLCLVRFYIHNLFKVAGENFKVVKNINKLKYEDCFEPGKTYPYLADPFEGIDE